MANTSAAGPSAPDFLAQRRASLGDVVTRHGFALWGAGTIVTGALSGVVLGGGITVLEVMGELEKPALGIPVGLALFGFGCFLFWRLRDDVKMRVEHRALGLVFTRAGDERVVPWSDVVGVSWMQSGSTGKVHITDLFLDLADGSRLTLPFERLSDRRALTRAITARLGVQFPHH